MADRLQRSFKTAALLGAAVFLSGLCYADEPAAPDVPPKAPEELVGVSFSAVLRGESGTLVGLQRNEGDKETRWLEPGQTFAGWKVIRLNTEGEAPRVVLKHGDEEIELGLRESVIVGAPAEVAGSGSEEVRLKRDFPVHYLLSQTAIAGAKPKAPEPKETPAEPATE